jgi:hypothetical protein
VEVSAAVDVAAEGRDAVVELADVRGQQAHVEIVALSQRQKENKRVRRNSCPMIETHRGDTEEREGERGFQQG